MANYGPIEYLLNGWYGRARKSQMQHYNAATWFGAVSVAMSIIIAALTAVAGSAYFKEAITTGKPHSSLASLLTLISAVLSGVLGAGGYAQKSERHRGVASRYGAVRREIEQTAALSPYSVGDNRAIDDIRKRMNLMAEEALTVPAFIWWYTDRIELRSNEAPKLVFGPTDDPNKSVDLTPDAKNKDEGAYPQVNDKMDDAQESLSEKSDDSDERSPE